MKKASKILALLLALMTVCAMTATSVFATSGNDVVSATQVPAANVKLTEIDLKDYGIKLTVPEYDILLRSDKIGKAVIGNMERNSKVLMDNNILLYDSDNDQNEMIIVKYAISPYTKSIGSYNKLSAQEISDELAAFDINTAVYRVYGQPESVTDEKLGGSTVLHAVFKDVNAGIGDNMTTDVITTIQNGVSYTIECRLGGMDTEEGVKRHDEIIDSLRFYAPSLGYGYDGNIAKNSYGINVFQLISSIILLILAGLLFFFFYRFSAFQKAADSSFNIFGFDMPYHSDGDDYSYSDEDGDGFDDEHDNN